MFDAEKLLGKVVQEVMGSSAPAMKGKKKKKKKKKSNSLMSNLTSGAGLMTAIGLGIGAYEILRDKSNTQHTGGHYPASTSAGGPPPVTAAPAQTGSVPPPPPPQSSTAPAPPVSTPAATEKQVEALAIRLIQVMVAAAHADGTMDSVEEETVINRLKDESFSQEEKMFLLSEMHTPKSIDELVKDINDPAIAKSMYMLAVATIEIDTPEERQWLNEFASRLGLSEAIRDFIEDQV